MIASPINDHACLAPTTDQVVAEVAAKNPALVDLATRFSTTDDLAAWFRRLPQRDDDGENDDGPKVDACKPPQRLRIPATDPNCVERAALYLAAGEMIDPKPIRQLATLDTPIGLHTFPVENGAPIILDPRVPQNCLDCGVAAFKQGPVTIEARDAIEWTAQLAEAGAASVRNGPSRVRRARNAMMQLVDDGTAPASPEVVEAIGWLLALAEKVARRYGPRALRIVRTTAQAVADLADEAAARTHRNMPWLLAAAQFIPPEYRSALAKIGMNVGANVLRSKLASHGIGDDMFGLVEEELNREGLTMGALAKPKKLPTLDNLFGKRAA